MDSATLTWLHDHRTPALDDAMLAITSLGTTTWMLAICIPTTIMLWWLRGRADAITFVASVLGSWGLNNLLKVVIDRPRPTGWDALQHLTTRSMPSGHAMSSATYAFTLIALLWSTRARVPLLAGGAMFVILVGISRPYLGVHYPSDVLVGWLVSAAWVALVMRVSRRWRRPRRPAGAPRADATGPSTPAP